MCIYRYIFIQERDRERERERKKERAISTTEFNPDYQQGIYSLARAKPAAFHLLHRAWNKCTKTRQFIATNPPRSPQMALIRVIISCPDKNY